MAQLLGGAGRRRLKALIERRRCDVVVVAPRGPAAHRFVLMNLTLLRFVG
jgi:hypothetical protein